MKKQHAHLLKLREIHTKRLRVLELQSAQFGISVPPHILLEIEDIKEEIANINIQIEKTLNFDSENGGNSEKSSSNQITINGSVTRSTIIIGNDNKVEGSTNQE